jgi:short-subunit dehydrogenase
MPSNAQFAIVTGASTGIGLELARRCAEEGFDLLIAADEPEIETVATSLRALGRQVDAIQADLATTDGVDKLYAATKGRRSMRCWRTPGAALATPFSIRISAGCAR